MADQYAVVGSTATMSCLAVAGDVSELQLELENAVTSTSEELTFADGLTPVFVS